MTAREALADWVARAGAVLDVGVQRNGGFTFLGGVCWKCMSTEATTELGVCDSCLSWLRCEDLGADSAEPTTTSSSTEASSATGHAGPAATPPPVVSAERPEAE